MICGLRRQAMIRRQQHHEGFVEQRLRDHVRLDERRGDEDGIEVAAAQLAGELG